MPQAAAVEEAPAAKEPAPPNEEPKPTITEEVVASNAPPLEEPAEEASTVEETPAEDAKPAKEVVPAGEAAPAEEAALAEKAAPAEEPAPAKEPKEEPPAEEPALTEEANPAAEAAPAEEDQALPEAGNVKVQNTDHIKVQNTDHASYNCGIRRARMISFTNFAPQNNSTHMDAPKIVRRRWCDISSTPSVSSSDGEELDIFANSQNGTSNLVEPALEHVSLAMQQSDTDPNVCNDPSNKVTQDLVRCISLMSELEHRMTAKSTPQGSQGSPAACKSGELDANPQKQPSKEHVAFKLEHPDVCDADGKVDECPREETHGAWCAGSALQFAQDFSNQLSQHFSQKKTSAINKDCSPHGLAVAVQKKAGNPTVSDAEGSCEGHSCDEASTGTRRISLVTELEHHINQTWSRQSSRESDMSAEADSNPTSGDEGIAGSALLAQYMARAQCIRKACALEQQLAQRLSEQNSKECSTCQVTDANPHKQPASAADEDSALQGTVVETQASEGDPTVCDPGNKCGDGQGKDGPQGDTAACKTGDEHAEHPCEQGPPGARSISSALDQAMELAQRIAFQRTAAEASQAGVIDARSQMGASTADDMSCARPQRSSLSASQSAQCGMYEPSQQASKGDSAPCAKCGKLLNAGFRFCTGCGHKVSASCENCGATSGIGFKFCTECHQIGGVVKANAALDEEAGGDDPETAGGQTMCGCTGGTSEVIDFAQEQLGPMSFATKSSKKLRHRKPQGARPCHAHEASDSAQHSWSGTVYGDEAWPEVCCMAKPLGDVKSPDMFKVGDKVKGTVLRLASFGAFVDIGSTCDGLLHISQICDDYISDPKEKLQEGQEIEVTVKEVDVPRQRVGLTCRSAGVGKPLQDLEIGQVVEGKVKRLTSFGAFVDIGAQADALLHVSEASDEFCSDISEKVQEGENIKAMIKELDVERRRIGISCRGMGPPPEEW